MFKLFFRNEKGSAFVFTIISIAVVFIFASTMVFLGSTNIKRASQEEKQTKAYYIAKTGAESMIKHLSDQADIRAQLENVIAKTEAGDAGKGNFDDGEFEIEVSKEIRDGKTVYIVKSKGKTMGIDNTESRDWTTAVLTPEYFVEGLGDGMIFVEGDLNLSYTPQLEGNGIKLYTKVKKDKRNVSPIKFEQYIEGLFKDEDNRWADFVNQTGKSKQQLIAEGYTLNDQRYQGRDKAGKILGDFSLIVKEYDSSNPNFIKQEILTNVSDTTGKQHDIEINYDVDSEERGKLLKVDSKEKKIRENMDLITSALSKSTASLTTSEKKILDDLKWSNVERKALTNIDANTASGSEAIVIDIGDTQLTSNKEVNINTSKTRDIVIVADRISVEGGAKINVTGDGKVRFFMRGEVQLNKGTIGVPEGVKSNAETSIYFKTNVQLQNGSKFTGVNLYGPDGNVNLQDGTEYIGLVICKTIDPTDASKFKSPESRDPDEDNDPIIGFSSIVWER